MLLIPFSSAQVLGYHLNLFSEGSKTYSFPVNIVLLRYKQMLAFPYALSKSANIRPSWPVFDIILPESSTNIGYIIVSRRISLPSYLIPVFLQRSRELCRLNVALLCPCGTSPFITNKALYNGETLVANYCIAFHKRFAMNCKVIAVHSFYECYSFN